VHIDLCYVSRHLAAAGPEAVVPPKRSLIPPGQNLTATNLIAVISARQHAIARYMLSSVRPSVRPSVTRVDQDQSIKDG